MDFFLRQKHQLLVSKGIILLSFSLPFFIQLCHTAGRVKMMERGRRAAFFDHWARGRNERDEDDDDHHTY